MSTVQIIAAIFGFLIIAATVWQLARNGVAKSNGKVETYDPAAGRNTDWTGDGY